MAGVRREGGERRVAPVSGPGWELSLLEKQSASSSVQGPSEVCEICCLECKVRPSPRQTFHCSSRGW